MANFLQDTFTAADSTALTAHTPDIGGSWVVHGSSSGTPAAAITSNRLAGGWNLYGAYYNDATPASADYTVAADVRTNGTSDTSSGGGVFARLSSAASLTGYLVRMRSNQFSFQRFVTGSLTALGTVSYTPASGVDYRLYLTCEGSTISVKCQRLDNSQWINGSGSEVGTETNMFSVTDGGVTAAGHAGVAARLAIYTFDNFAAGTGASEFTESVTSTMSLGQSQNAGESKVASSTLNFSLSTVGFNIIQARQVPENILSLTQSAVVSGLVNATNSILSLSSLASASLLGPQPVSQDLGLGQEVDVVFGVPHSAPWGVAGIAQNLGLSGSAFNSATLEVSQDLGLTQVAFGSLALSSEISFVQAVSGGIGYDRSQTISLSQSVSLSGSEWVRSLTSTFAATSASLGWNGNDSCFRRFGIDSRPQAAGKFSLFSTDGQHSIVLRNPEVDNVRRSTYDRVVRETRGGDLIVYKDSSWNTLQTLLFTVIALKRDTLSNLQTFLSNTLGQEIVLVDWLGEEWSGVVINSDETITEDRDGYWTLPLEFEGNKLPGSGSYQSLGLSQSATATVV